LDKITTTIERWPLQEIAAQRKKVEYREIKPYWEKRLAAVKVPFLMRMINGMRPNAPEVTVKIKWKRRNRQTGQFALSIGKVVEIKNWNVKRGC
jgi:hypothetical protein